MDSLIDDSSLDRCQRCKGDLPGEPNQPSAWPSALCPKCLKAVRMTWMQDDLDERGNLWREFVVWLVIGLRRLIFNHSANDIVIH